MHLDFFGLFGIRTGWLALTASDWLADGLGTRVRECESLYSKRVTQSEKPREAEGELESVREEKRRESRDSGEEEGERRERERDRSACLARVASSLTLPQGQDRTSTGSLTVARLFDLPALSNSSTAHHITAPVDWTAPHHCTLAIRCRPTSTYLTTTTHHHHCTHPHRPHSPTTPRPLLRSATRLAIPYHCPPRPPARRRRRRRRCCSIHSLLRSVTAVRTSPERIAYHRYRRPSTAERHLHTLHPAPPYQLALVHAHTATPWGLPMSQPGAQPFLGESGQGALLDICASACRVTCVSYESPVSWPAKTTLHRRCALPLQVTALTYVLWLLLL